MSTMKQLTRAAFALGAAVFLRKVFQKAAQDPNLRQKAGELGQNLRDRAWWAGKATGETMSQWARTLGKQAPVVGREAARKIKKLAGTAMS